MSLLLNSTTAKREWDFDPTTIPDCQIWFDGADTSTLTLSGTTVKAWRNKGSIVMNAIEDTGTVTSGNTINGLNYITCPVGAHLGFTCALTIQARSVFVVARNTTQLTGSNFWGPLNQTAGAGQMAVVVSRPSATATTYPADMGASGFGGNTISTGANGPNPFGQVNLYAFVQSSTATANNAITINGNPSMITSNLAANYNVGFVKYVINTAGYNTGSDICEILYYSRDVSVMERRAIEGYLMWKWGIKRQNEVAFTPTSIANCALWYDADVNYADTTSRATSFTFSSGDSVDVWKDKSGNGRDATFLNVSPSTTRPVLTGSQVAGKPTVIFAGASVLKNLYSLPTTQAHTVFVVAAPNTIGFRSAFSLNAHPGTRGSELNVYNTSGNLWWYSGGNGPTDGYTTGIVSSNGRYDILAFYWSSTLRTQTNVNGHYQPSSTSSPASLTANSVGLIGGTTTATAGSTTPFELWSGGIAEIILYTAILTTDQRNQVERYLSLKWNRPLVNACAISHPNKWLPVTQRRFNPTDISGCSLWLDGLDSSTMALSGSNVSQWRDKSINGYNANQATAGNQPTFSGNGVVFNGSSSYLQIASPVIRPAQIFIVAQSSSQTGHLLRKGSGGGVDFEFAMRYNSGNVQVLYANTGSTVVTAQLTGGVTSSVVLLEGTWNGTTVTLYTNGTQRATGALSGTQYVATTGATDLRIGAEYASASNTSGPFTGTLWNGTIYEIVMYNTFLSNGDRQKIEGYLADKWGLRGEVASTHPVYYPLPTSSTAFHPTQVSGLSLWLDGADSSSSSMTLSGSALTQWKDKSGNIFTPGTAFNSPTLVTNALNGRTAVNFNSASSQYIDFGDANDLFTNQFCLFVVCNFTSTSGDGSIIAKSYAGNGAGRYALIREAGVVKPLLERSGVIANNSGWTSTSTEVRIFTMQWDRSNLTLYHNGTSVFTTAFAESASTSFNNTYKLLVGAYLNSTASAPVSTLYFNGVIMEILQYLAPVTTVQRQRIENYLSDKWGMQWSSQVTTPVPFYNPTIPDTISFNPATRISGCRFWIDAADTSTINSGLITAGSTVTSLADKSGTGITITTAGTPVWNYLLNKLPTINVTNGRFTGSFPSAITNFVHTCFIVGTLNSNPTAGYPCFGIANTATSATRWIRCLDWATSLRTVAFWGSVPVTLITPPANGTPFLWCCTFNGVNPLSSILNSGTAFNSSSTIATAPGANASFFAISTEPWSAIGSTTNTWPGHVSEIIVYDRVLSTVDRIRVEKYLARKWGLNQTILAANRFTNPGAIPNSPTIFPTTFTDIALWLDAADPDADGLMPASGTKVNRWIDKSGNSKTCVQNTLTQQPTFTFVDGYPVIQFSAASLQFMVGPALLTSLNYGIFVVSRYTGAVGSAGRSTAFFNRKVVTANANNFVAVYDYFNAGAASLVLSDIYYNNAASATYKSGYTTSGVGTVTLKTISDNSAQPAAGQQVAYFNGTLGTYEFLNNATANVATDAEGYRLGVSNINGTLANYFTGYICEIIVILHQPTTQERLFIEGYLAWKWGLNASLPSAHAYRLVKP
jgi:hypothetical protein